MEASSLVDNRLLEVVADGLPLIEGTQLAVDTTLVCPLHGDGTAHRKSRGKTEEGANLSRAPDAWQQSRACCPCVGNLMLVIF